MMWNPFRRIKLEPITPNRDVKPATGSETNPAYRNQVEQAQLRSLSARTQLSMIQESLAERALTHIRGGDICPE